MTKANLARLFLCEIARANYGELAGFGPMIRQADNSKTRLYGVAGWFLRSLYVSPNLIFAEGRIWDSGRFVGCPNPPDCYLVKHGDIVRRFRDYDRALRYCAIQAYREIMP